MFIVGNSKPVNKYSLIAIGRSIFTEPLIEFPRSYGLDIKDWDKGFDIEVVIKDMSTTEEVKIYYNKHREYILKETIAKYQEVKIEYIQSRQNYTKQDFKDLITWTCPKCDNFHTNFDSFSYDYIPQCYRHNPHIDMIKTSKGDS